ncbi:MAG: hypothetical protein HYY79_04935 [Betaproteobacteria bacterium]|nr:hypothetical protein [Betaproteobacteria bacterium]
MRRLRAPRIFRIRAVVKKKKGAHAIGTYNTGSDSDRVVLMHIKSLRYGGCYFLSSNNNNLTTCFKEIRDVQPHVECCAETGKGAQKPEDR